MNSIHPCGQDRRRRCSSFALVISALIGFAAACGGNAGQVSPDSTGTTSLPQSLDTEAAFPVTLEHKYGATVIPKQPKRVVAAGFTDQDFVLALGVTPVGVTDFIGPFPEEERPWAREALGGVKPEKVSDASGELNFERISALRPDLILYYSYADKSDYEKLAQIAPTVVEAEDGSPWQEQTLITGRALGREDQAKELVAKVEAQFEQATQEHPEFVGKVATVQFNDPRESPGFFVLEPTDPIFRFFASLDFKPPEMVGPLSEEQVNLLDQGDVLIVIGAPQEYFEGNALFQSLEAVRDGRVVYFGGFETQFAGAIGFSSPLSLPYALDIAVPALAAALDGDPATEPKAAS
jgi:iron complex transport system substrate-binding protein